MHKDNTFSTGKTSVPITVTAEEGSYIKSVSPEIDWTYNSDEIKTGTLNIQDKESLDVVFGGMHNVNVSETGHGSVTVSSESAKPGDTITVYTNSDSGYEVDAVSVKCGNNDVDVTQSGSSYTFEMPDGDVTVTADFKAMMPYESKAAHIRDFTQYEGEKASLWEGVIAGRGVSFNPSVTVTLTAEDGETEPKSKTVEMDTVVNGTGYADIGIVVDRVKSEISSVVLNGVEVSPETSETAE